MTEITNTIAAIGMIILITTISGACIFGWILVIRNWKTIWKKKS